MTRVRGASISPPTPPALVWINCGAVLCAVVDLAFVASRYWVDRDFAVYYSAAAALRTGGDPYQVPAYVYSPLFAWLLEPLVALDLPHARFVWFLLQCAALVSFVWLCIRESGSRLAHRWWGIVLFCTVGALPTALDLRLGEVGSFFAFLIVASLAASYRCAPLAGFLLAVAVSTKFSPVFLWVGYMCERRWSVVRWTVVFGLLLFILALLTCGIDNHLALLRKLASGADYPLTAEHNASLVALWLRLFTVNPSVRPLINAPWMATTLIAASSLGLLGACLWLTQPNGDRPSRVLNFSLWVGAMLLLSPANGLYNLMLLLLPALGAVRYLEQQPNRGLVAALLLALVLLSVPPMSNLYAMDELQSLPWMALFLTPSVYALLLMFCLTAMLAHQRRAMVSLTR